ncbi:helix-turn-helix transcriptional regulator [Ligilactobacillus faecis]|uniref:Helix-turn-helix transcriptional regulator n=1 Tax=Ligilactobacillus faecis TaxID=762833 RepID=A0ABV4DN08_9LACO
MHPGPLLRQIRLSKKMTLQKASKNVVTVSALAKFERGETNLAVDSFLEILKNLHISLHQFSFFTSNKN